MQPSITNVTFPINSTKFALKSVIEYPLFFASSLLIILLLFLILVDVIFFPKGGGIDVLPYSIIAIIYVAFQLLSFRIQLQKAKSFQYVFEDSDFKISGGQKPDQQTFNYNQIRNIYIKNGTLDRLLNINVLIINIGGSNESQIVKSGRWLNRGFLPNQLVGFSYNLIVIPAISKEGTESIINLVKSKTAVNTTIPTGFFTNL